MFPSPQGGSETSLSSPSNWVYGSFHPLKAGRRRVSVACNRNDNAVSIPSRRVGDAFHQSVNLHQVHCFHPLKAGRRPSHLLRSRPPSAGFHPLKAGRRLNWVVLRVSWMILFPSPQGGSETFAAAFSTLRQTVVSIPSRRVGDRTWKASNGCCKTSFHPLKAGRRPKICVKPFFHHLCFHPLKAGRRLFYVVRLKGREVGFHPLKAGRRRPTPHSQTTLDPCFHPLKAGRRPRGNEGKGGQKKAKGREGCRRPSVGGKS